MCGLPVISQGTSSSGSGKKSQRIRLVGDIQGPSHSPAEPDIRPSPLPPCLAAHPTTSVAASSPETVPTAKRAGRRRVLSPRGGSAVAAVSEGGSENDAGDEAETQPRQTRQRSKPPTISTAHLPGPVLSVRHPPLSPIYPPSPASGSASSSPDGLPALCVLVAPGFSLASEPNVFV